MAGAIDKKDELELLKKLKIKNYKLSDFNVTEEGNVLIVTYKVSADEKIGGKTLSHKPTPRMSIFAKVGGGWKWLAHANLNR
jgi:ketosteroid isomerase-like protein